MPDLSLDDSILVVVGTCDRCGELHVSGVDINAALSPPAHAIVRLPKETFAAYERALEDLDRARAPFQAQLEFIDRGQVKPRGQFAR